MDWRLREHGAFWETGVLGGAGWEGSEGGESCAEGFELRLEVIAVPAFKRVSRGVTATSCF